VKWVKWVRVRVRVHKSQSFWQTYSTKYIF
jgi:hypothetical protein